MAHAATADGGDGRTHHISGMTYVGVWIGLLVLTAVSYVVSKASLGFLDTPIMLGIATVKAIAVVMIFMHLLEAHLANRLVVIVSALFIVLLVGLTVADVVTRRPVPAILEPPIPGSAVPPGLYGPVPGPAATAPGR